MKEVQVKNFTKQKTSRSNVCHFSFKKFPAEFWTDPKIILNNFFEL